MSYNILTKDGKTNVIVEKVSELTCCKCKIKITLDDDSYDDALHWENHCGYGSIFGDGAKISLTLCGPCLKLVANDLLIIKQYGDYYDGVS
jgi:hypothetical protein